MKISEVIKNNIETLISLSNNYHLAEKHRRWVSGMYTGVLFLAGDERYSKPVCDVAIDTRRPCGMSIALYNEIGATVENINLEDYFYDLKNPTEEEVDILSITHTYVFEFLMESSLFDSSS